MSSFDNSFFEERYNKNLADSDVFQDWLSDKLRCAHPGFILGIYGSKLYQIQKGESFSGVEVKNDRLMEKTGNLYFEVEEKHEPKDNWTKSGVYRKDICWLYLIANNDEAFMFSCKQMCILYENKKKWPQYKLEEKETHTSRGFIIPREKLINSPYLLQHWVFDEEAVKLHHPGQKIY